MHNTQKRRRLLAALGLALLVAAATPAVAWAVGLPPVPAALLALPCGLVVLAHRDSVRALVGRRRAGGPP